MGSFVAAAGPGIAPVRGEALAAGRCLWLALLAGWLAAGCAADLVRTEDGYRHIRHRYSIGVPGGPGPAWEEIDVKDAWVAFRRAGPQTLSMQSRCGRPVAHPAIMARSLVLGIRDRRLRQAGPIVVAGRNGWSQTFDTASDGVVLRVKTVTVVIDGCTFDWTLAAIGDFAAAERAFDAWWGSFRLDPPDGGVEKRS
jgi:hypothetical protein